MADSVTSPKYWSVSGTLRGFYDDNYNITGNGKGSFGVQAMPSVSFHVPLQQTDLGLRYTYGAYYYQDRNDIGVNPFDQSHQVDLWVDHAFNERWKARVNDTFAVGQEPELLNPNPSGPNPTPYRLNGDNIANHGAISLDTEWTRLLSTTISYDNNFYDYDNSGATTVAYLFPPSWNLLVGPGGTSSSASLSGLLDRDEEGVSFDLKWHVLPETIAFVGYQFSWVNYTGNEPIAVYNYSTPVFGSIVYRSSDRDSYTHYGYLGISQAFTPNLNLLLKAGASYTDEPNLPLGSSTSVNPYADISLNYTYLPGSYVQFGFTQDIGATDQINPDSTGHITQYAKDSVVYADVNHRITEKLTGTLIGRVQYSTFEGGSASSADEVWYSVGLNLGYQITQHFSVDGGYNYDNLVTKLAGLQYSRNRVYLGLTATY